MVDERLGVPLNSEQERLPPSLDALDHAVVRPRNRAQTTAELIDALVVKGINSQAASTSHRREATAGSDADLVADLRARLALAVNDRSVRDLLAAFSSSDPTPYPWDEWDGSTYKTVSKCNDYGMPADKMQSECYLNCTVFGEDNNGAGEDDLAAATHQLVGQLHARG